MPQGHPPNTIGAHAVMLDMLREVLFCPIHGIFAPANLTVIRILLMGVLMYFPRMLARLRAKEKKDD
jgi:hypothetical protein